jgi:hypothetical protein
MAVKNDGIAAVNMDALGYMNGNGPICLFP